MMKPGWGRRTPSAAAGLHVAAVPLLQAISALAAPTSSARSVRARETELNPVENIWQFMRDNWLANRVFKSYADIVDHCRFAWNTLVSQPWKIISIGLRDWAHGC